MNAMVARAQSMVPPHCNTQRKMTAFCIFIMNAVGRRWDTIFRSNPAACEKSSIQMKISLPQYNSKIVPCESDNENE